MRTRIKIDGKYYRPVPWLEEASCEGCSLEGYSVACSFNVEANGNPCNTGNEFAGRIMIRMTATAMAEYLARRLGT